MTFDNLVYSLRTKALANHLLFKKLQRLNGLIKGEYLHTKEPIKQLQDPTVSTINSLEIQLPGTLFVTIFEWFPFTNWPFKKGPVKEIETARWDLVKG